MHHMETQTDSADRNTVYYWICSLLFLPSHLTFLISNCSINNQAYPPKVLPTPGHRQIEIVSCFLRGQTTSENKIAIQDSQKFFLFFFLSIWYTTLAV